MKKNGKKYLKTLIIVIGDLESHILDQNSSSRIWHSTSGKYIYNFSEDSTMKVDKDNSSTDDRWRTWMTICTDVQIELRLKKCEQQKNEI